MFPVLAAAPCRRHLLPRRRRHRLRAALDRSVRGWGAILPEGAAPETRLLLAARGLRAVGDGGLLLPVYLLELGHGPFETGIIATATLAGSALLTSSSASTLTAPRDAPC